MRNFSLSWFTLFLMSLFIASSRNRRPDPVALVNDYGERANAHDIPAIMRMFAGDAQMRMFAEDAQFELVGQGPEAIRALHEYDKALQTTLTLQNCAADGLTVMCETIERNNWLDAAGLDEIFYRSVFTFNQAGLIQSITATVSSEDGRVMDAVLAEFIPWLKAERAAESAPLFGPDGQFIYSEVNGRLVAQLLKEWQGAKGG